MTLQSDVPDPLAEARNLLEEANSVLSSLRPASEETAKELYEDWRRVRTLRYSLTFTASNLTPPAEAPPDSTQRQESPEALPAEAQFIIDQLESAAATLQVEERTRRAKYMERAPEPTRSNLSRAVKFLTENPWITSSGVYAAICVFGLLYAFVFYWKSGIDFGLYSDLGDFFLVGFVRIPNILVALIWPAIGLLVGALFIKTRFFARLAPGYHRTFESITKPQRLLGLVLVLTLTSVCLSALQARSQKERSTATAVAYLTSSAPIRNVRVWGGTHGYVFLQKEKKKPIAVRRNSVLCIGDSPESGKCVSDAATNTWTQERAVYTTIQIGLKSLRELFLTLGRRFGPVSTAEYAEEVLNCSPVPGYMERVDFRFNDWQSFKAVKATAASPRWRVYAQRLVQNDQGRTIWVLGFASTAGNVNYNMRLSERRAQQVAKSLRKYAKDEHEHLDIRTRGLGEELLVSGESGNQPSDQRAEILVCGGPTGSKGARDANLGVRAQATPVASPPSVSAGPTLH